MPEDLPNATSVQSSVSRIARVNDWVVGGVFFVLIAVVSYFLFVSGKSTPLFGNIQEAAQVTKDYGVLTVAYDQPLTTYEPTVSDLVTRGYLANTYEGLVRFDVNLNVAPALALSWGMLDDLTWQFKLRPDVVFHDGSLFDATDVKASIDRARTHPDSQIQSLVSSLDDIEVVDDLTLRFVTRTPDPILLNKLTALPMVPSETRIRVTNPVGTGPYVFNRTEGDVWFFDRNNRYWGVLPAYPALVLTSVPDKFQRYEDFLDHKIDVMAQVPPVFVSPLLDQDYKIASQPSLEVNFFLFSWVRPDSPFRHRALRDAMRYLFDPVQLDKLTGGYSRSIGQFVSRGVFGYNPDLEVFPYDLELARQKVASLGPLEIALDLPRGLEPLGDYVKKTLTEVGLTPVVTYWDPEAYSERVVSGKSDFFFFGWRSELGDGGEFFDTLIHSFTLDERYGALNHGRYEDKALDQRIEANDRNLLETPRLEALQDLMDYVVNDAIVGVPLFETDTLVAIQSDLQWNPRVDNFILAADFQ